MKWQFENAESVDISDLAASLGLEYKTPHSTITKTANDVDLKLVIKYFYTVTQNLIKQVDEKEKRIKALEDKVESGEVVLIIEATECEKDPRLLINKKYASAFT